MSQFNLSKLRKQLGGSNRHMLSIMAGVIGGLLLLVVIIFFVFIKPGKQGSSIPKSQQVGLENLPYWQEKSANVLFDWQPEDQPAPIQLSGERIAGNKASSEEISPGFELINEGYSMVKINQGKLSPLQGATG